MTRFSMSLCAGLLWTATVSPLYAEARVESNLIYGMYSGLALLMDVHYPEQSNGFGVIVIPGSAWTAPLSLDATPLKTGVARPYLGATALLENGYTVFSINHRATPRFPFPAAVEDAQRAVRFIRHNAPRFGIEPDQIGALGGSSGGYLVSMLGVLDGAETAAGLTPIDEESSRVQAVVALYPATDLSGFAATARGGSNALLTMFVGAYMGAGQADDGSEEASLYAEASATTHVSADDPPFLLVHGDADEAVPFSQSEALKTALDQYGVVSELIRMPGGGHGAAISAGPNPPDYLGPLVEWFDRHLRGVE